MAITIQDFDWPQFDELKRFLTKWSPDHPELGQGDIVAWQKCDRFVAIYEGCIVGYIAQIKHSFRYGDKITKVYGRQTDELLGWGVTLVLDGSNDQIRKEAGRGLLSRCENNDCKYSGVGMIPSVEDVYKRRGHVIRRDCCNMYARFFNPHAALAYMGPKWGVYEWAIKVGNVFNKSRPARLVSSWNAEECIREDCDDFTNKTLRDNYELYGYRDKNFLDYKLSQPNRDYKMFWWNGSYIIFRMAIKGDFAIVKICDIVASVVTKPLLIGMAISYAIEQEVDAIVAIDSAQDAAIYRKAGMWLKRAYPICMSPDIKAKMRITFFDSDLDNLW